MIVRPARNTDGDAINKIRTECGLGDDHVYEWTGIILVAERGGEIVGFAQAIPAKPISFFALLGVLPEHRKSRAAHKLVEGIELLLRANGCTEWVAFIDADNGSWSKTVESWGAETYGYPGHLMKRGL